MSVRPIRNVLVALLIVGCVGAIAPNAPTATHADFVDGHDANGFVNASSNFGGGPSDPTADAGGPYTVDEGGQLTLDPSGSTADQGTIREYSWTLVSGPGGGWYSPRTGWALYNAPDDVQGTTQAVVRLTVTDNRGWTDTDTAVITIRDTNSAGGTSSTQMVGTNGRANGNGGTRETFGNTTGDGG